MKPTLRIVFIVAFAALLASGCKTQFVGEPKVPGGAQGCAAQCSALGMELAGMVVMGEYSDGCICAVPGRTPPAATAAFLYVGASGVVAAAAGVRMQMDDEEENQRRQGRGW
jgi:hypothetical protein